MNQLIPVVQWVVTVKNDGAYTKPIESGEIGIDSTRLRNNEGNLEITKLMGEVGDGSFMKNMVRHGD